MKKIISIALCCMLSFPLLAQDKSKLQERVKKSDKEIGEAKKMAQPKTWLNRAELFVDIWSAPTKSIMTGMAHKDIKLILAKEKVQETLTQEVEGVTYDVDVYADKKLYYGPEGLLTFWQVTDYAAPEPLFRALEAYQRASEIDVKGSNTKKIREGLTDLQTKFNNDALAAYSLQNYNEALVNFEASLTCVKHPAVAKTDSLITYYTGLVARASGDNVKAAEYFKQAIAINYEQNGDMYAMYAEALLASGDTAAAQTSLAEGMEKYPTNQSVIVGLINVFLLKGEDPKKILPYVNKAQQNDPENATLYYAEGLVYEQLHDSENAAKSYKTSIEKDPKGFFANYSLGALYFNEAVQTSQKAADELDQKKYEEMMKVFDGQLRQALPYLEQAYELNSSERAVLESLKSIYFRLREESPEMQKKYEFYNEKLQNM